MHRAHGLVSLAAVLLLLTPARASAQTAVRDALTPVSGQSACTRALPPSAYTRVPVFVHGEVADTLDRGARPFVDLAAQAAARFVRVALWGSVTVAARADSAARLAPADSLFARRALDGGVRVVARRGGALTWRPTVPRYADGAVADSAAARLLARAVAAARDSGEIFIPDDAILRDSLVFDLEHAHQRLTGPGGALAPLRVRNPAPVFTLPLLWETGATVVAGSIRPNYPSDMQRGGFEGRVVLGFVIDTAGRAEPATVRDLNPDVESSLAPGLRDAYRQFVRASRDAVVRGRFVPAAVGGCPVRQFVVQALGFTLNR